MSTIKYTQEASDAIKNAGEEAVQRYTALNDRMAYQLGAVQYAFKALALRAEHDSSLSGVANRLAESMEFDLCQASELIDAIIAGVRRQHGEVPEAFISLGDGAQALYEAFEVAQSNVVDDMDHYEEAALDAKHRAEDQRQAA